MLELLLNGVFTGSLYALFGIGLAVTFGLMRQINLAHGDLIVLSAYLAFFIVEATGLHPIFALPFVALLMFAVGYVLQRFVLNRTMGQSELSPLLVTFGLSIILQNALQEMFSADTRSLDPGAIGPLAIDVGGVSVGVMPMVFLLLAIAVFAIVSMTFKGTRFGRALRATSDDGRTARLMGIEIHHIFALALGLSLAMSAVAAIFLGMRATFSPAAGPERMLFAFEAVVLGGLGSIWGTFVGGIVLGLAQSLGQSISPVYGAITGHIVFLIILLIRPQGLIVKRAK